MEGERSFEGSELISWVAHFLVMALRIFTRDSTSSLMPRYTSRSNLIGRKQSHVHQVERERQELSPARPEQSCVQQVRPVCGSDDKHV